MSFLVSAGRAWHKVGDNITALSNGNFVSTDWASSYEVDSRGVELERRDHSSFSIFRPDGTLIVQDASTPFDEEHPSIGGVTSVALPAGRFMVIASSVNDSKLYTAVYNALGKRVFAPQELDVRLDGPLQAVRLENGRVIVTDENSSVLLNPRGKLLNDDVDLFGDTEFFLDYGEGKRSLFEFGDKFGVASLETLASGQSRINLDIIDADLKAVGGTRILQNTARDDLAGLDIVRSSDGKFRVLFSDSADFDRTAKAEIAKFAVLGPRIGPTNEIEVDVRYGFGSDDGLFDIEAIPKGDGQGGYVVGYEGEVSFADAGGGNTGRVAFVQVFSEKGLPIGDAREVVSEASLRGLVPDDYSEIRFHDIAVSSKGKGVLTFEHFVIGDDNSSASDDLFELRGESFWLPQTIREGNRSSNRIEGDKSADGIAGGKGNDTLTGLGGDDMLDGGEGKDGLFGNRGNDALYGGEGNDALFGGSGRDELFGGAGIDTLRGQAGNDMLSGADGRDQLFGDGGHDTLNGGAANDTLTGGAGRDVFKFVADPGNSVREAVSFGRDVIKDFNPKQDLIDLTDIRSSYISYDSSRFDLEQNRGNVVLTLTDPFGEDPGTIVVQGVKLAQMTEDVFLFAEA